MNPSRKSLSKRSQTQQTKIMQESQNLREKLEGGESNMAAKKRSCEPRNELTTHGESMRNSPIQICRVRVHSPTHTSMGKGKEQEKKERNTSQTKKKFKNPKRTLAS